MLLHVTIASAPGTVPPAGMTRRELVIKMTAALSGSAVAALLEQRYGQGRYTIHGSALEELTPGEAPFITGAVILHSTGSPDGVPGADAAHPGAPPLRLAVCAGPDAGSIIALQRGIHTIGRAGPADGGAPPQIGIADPALSRQHAELVVGAETVLLRDLGSANGTWVDGRRVRRAAVDTGSTLRFGYSSCRLFLPSAWQEAPGPPEDPFQPLTVRFPEHGAKTGLLLVGALLPLVLGIVLALATGMWMFLAFSAVSAVTALITAAGARRRRREQAAEIARAAEEDGTRRRLAAPDPGATALAVESVLQRNGRVPSTPVCPVRIGAGTQPANLEAVPPQPHFAPPQLTEVPVVLFLGKDREICLQGSARDTAALGRTLLLQASAAAGPLIVCVGTAAELETSARFLPRVALAALPAASPAAVGSASARLRTLISDLPVPAGDDPFVLFVHRSWAEHAGQLLQALPEPHFAHAGIIRIGGPPAPVTVTLLGGRGTFASGGSTFDFVPDLIQPGTFERLSRRLAARRLPIPLPAEAPGRLPSSAAFDEFHPLSPDQLLGGWQANARVDGGAAVVGVSPSGPVTLDLDKDGPHFLVAGTTGSGKSEFLRTFVGSLAASHPPTLFTVLLIDFKGGSGLGPLAPLPHSVGLLTDFSAETVARALVSLRAEVRRREVLLAGAGADNLSAYNAGRSPAEGLPRLLVVVDEFRMLADEVPAALPELLRIAAIGRSLGLHLLLATQRPQGAITTDIRANIATSIALRVQSGVESRDVINTDTAAAIPPDIPGRAYVSKGGLPPHLFQSLSTSLRGGTGESPLKELAEHYRSPGADAVGDPKALNRVVSAVRAAAAIGGFPVPFSPVRPPLPSSLTAEQLTRCADDILERLPGGLVLGLLDEPGKQRQRTLCWHPDADSHLALLGAPRSGAPDALELIAGMHLAELPGRHLYILDSDGSLAWLAAAEQTGAYVGADDTARAARVLAYLGSLILQAPAPATSRAPGGRRQAGSVDPQHSGIGMAADGRAAGGTTLIITGWARWCTAFRAGRGLSGEEDLADLVRDGERAGICVVLAGDREVLNARFFPHIPNRMFFPADASAETLLIWPRLPPMDRVRGRALVQGRCGTAEGLSAQLLAHDPREDPEQLMPLPPGRRRPHRIENLPVSVQPSALGPAPTTDHLPVGVYGDELDTASVRMPPGSVFLVAGPRASGRTSFLRQLQRAADSSLECCLVSTQEELEPVFSAMERQQEDLRRFLILVDDSDSLPAPSHQRLAGVQARGARIVLAAVSGHQLTARVPLALHIRSAPHGALLRPVTQADGDVFGVRVDPAARRPPGRCYLVDGTEVLEAQAAYDPAD
ncbi:FtsK/SpoIIIE domain-containing protein [Arthrobacter sp. zg-Y1110]|uniref:FtsK/SpoIIIE domain-containing protein n=1 Tax=Arthrobacter sp. zg-Y1110 TaxID=2886932 RepID=UPI001D15C7EC|nr:FtsK/SpoIIIE domain-containing protein [Arthrobacter sp. zg-Y1110]MCC3290475.1 FHA domain-containing protein [Arthrobacter sp. zg-Y1110]UWX84158.1 FtsK/SpoIIIE domain-containing protein [Arthrobacter sp. zg-Y1110]